MDLDLRSILQLAILALGAYVVLGFLRTSRGGGLVRGILVSLVFGAVGVWWLAKLLALEELEHIIQGMAGYVVVVLAIIFQPELRRGIAQLGVPSVLSRLFGAQRTEAVAEVAQTVRTLAKRRHGALVAFERETPLDDYIGSGVKIDATVNRTLLESVFHPGGALHDGAVVIRKNRVAAALCLFPLTENVEIAKSTGTRHRAALGLTDETDAVTVAVSEETGDVSICQNGQMQRPVAPRDLERLLRESLAAEGDTGEEAEGAEPAGFGHRALAFARALVTTDVPRKLAALLIAAALFWIAHQDLTIEERVLISVRSAPADGEPVPAGGELLVLLPDRDHELIEPAARTLLTLEVTGTRADTENLTSALAGVLKLRQATPPEGLDLPLEDVVWSRRDGREAGGLRVSFAGPRPPRLVVEQAGRREFALAVEHVPIEGQLDPRWVAHTDRLRCEPTHVVLRGPLRRLNELGTAALPLRLEPLVLRPEDRGEIAARLKLDRTLLEAGFSLDLLSFVTVRLPIEPAPRGLSSIEREIAVVDLGAAGGAEVASWALPPHARTARFRIYTLGLVAAEGADSPERQAVTAAIRRYVEENLLAFVDVSGVGQAAEGRSATVHHVWRRPWQQVLTELAADEAADLWVELESDAEVLLVDVRPPESGPADEDG